MTDDSKKALEIPWKLPEHLAERSRFHSANSVNRRGSFVLYWMRNALRADENPALDVARVIADSLSVPLLVYQGLSEHYRFASDRHHTFILQGAKDVQRQLAELGVSYAFHLATPADRLPHLVTLATDACVVVTEDMPVDPPRHFLDRLLHRCDTPVVTVDTACVVPMRLVQKPHTRAFKFRSATKKLYQQRVSKRWPSQNIQTPEFELDRLPFDPVELQTASIPELVARCEIDHTVGPIVDTVGGSTAGYRRWNQFRQKKLARYARTRNNALVDGVSRMSAYLHYGMVSPMRLARDADEFDNAGGEKYLDELLIWRELAYAFCFYRKDHDQWTAIPDWAQATLSSHADDPRDQIYSWEELARGQTDDSLWNVAQQSLLRHGELHNNVRMTWGKAILNWTETPQEALLQIINLNHRYALDGRDPASYGGILWCLGQFDRPFDPEQSVIGTVRPRPTRVHAKRLNIEAYQKHIASLRIDSPPRIAVIGAGISGLIAARTLTDQGLEVTVFDKGRGVGGRMSTRRTDFGHFDHGAQYFTARDSRFQKYVESWIHMGLVSQWPDLKRSADQRIVVLEKGQIQSESKSSDRFVAVPGMSALCKHLAQGLNIHLNTRVSNVDDSGTSVELFDFERGSLGSFNHLVVTAPAAQAVELLGAFPTLVKQINPIEMNPCWAAMASFDRPVTDQWVGAFLHGSFLSWTARNSSKPGRPSTYENVVIHASPEWTSEHWEDDPEKVANEMLEEFWRVTGVTIQTPIHLSAHRWKYAIPVEPSAQRCFLDSSGRVIAAGDWASGSRVEGAFLSGMSAAGRVLGQVFTGDE
ncbi:MAG: FAD-dependent oxidoreductase [Planctomycetota bacterium]